MELFYRSTRNENVMLTASEAILKGLSDEGGLFVPEYIPKLPVPLADLAGMDYQETAYVVMKQFLTDFTEEELRGCIRAAYDDKFDNEEIAPIAKVDGVYYLELFHGPTIAFKDMALSILPHLMTTAARKHHVTDEIVILTATSGDTGKAALAGFADVEGTRIIVFYPKGGVSDVQRLQMVTQKGDNTAVIAIHGNFDEAQSGVKKMFEDERLKAELQKAGFRFSSANSINIGRLVPQIVYYVHAYGCLLKHEEIQEGEAVNVVVPTGNFGNILAAYFAKQMGVPIAKLICASNENNVLTDFIRTGVYNKNRPFHTTSSPSMDILVSSNLERLLYDMTGGNDALVASWMKSLNDAGVYTVNAEVKAKMDELFYGGYCDEQGTKAAIKEMFETENYLIDPHTAVAVNVYQQYLQETGDLETPAIIASTASPYKFAASVLEALTGERGQGSEFDKVAELSALTGTQIPQPIADLQQKPLRFAQVCNIAGMEMAVLGTLGIQ